MTQLPSSKDIKHRIEQAFEDAADAQAIWVEAKNDKVILRGTVDSCAQRERAELAARSTPGVSRVQSRILDRETLSSL
jgi:osmotically-inducible protein OsmY